MNSKLVVEHIVSWLKSYADKAGSNGFVLGISGGVDSAVTSALCARTGLRLLCLELPIHQDINQRSRATAHIQSLQKNFPNLEAEVVSLSSVYDEFSRIIPTPSNREVYDLGLANTRSRLRMTTLYYYAGIYNLLVAGTGNKIEDFGIGFFTKYGDGGVDLSPIGDLTKTQVYQLGKELDILPEIMAAPPTDGLFGDNRTDEDQIGASYPELEWAMDFHGDEKQLSQRQKEVLEIYRKRHRQNLHKINPIPICEIPEELKV